MFYIACHYLLGANGKLTASVPNPAVHADLFGKVHSWITAGATIDDVIERLGLQTVPTGYTIHTWTEGVYLHIKLLYNYCKFHYVGKDETMTEKLKSILAQLEYSHLVNLGHSKGLPFKDHLYVPEVHPVTGFGFL